MNLFTALRQGFRPTWIALPSTPKAPSTPGVIWTGPAPCWPTCSFCSTCRPAAAWRRIRTRASRALLLYPAVPRAGLVYLPLNPAYQQAELEHFPCDAEPALVVCAGRNFGWVSKPAFQLGTAYVFTLNDDRSGTPLDRAAQMPDTHTPVPIGPATWPPSATPAAPGAARARC